MRLWKSKSTYLNWGNRRGIKLHVGFNVRQHPFTAEFKPWLTATDTGQLDAHISSSPVFYARLYGPSFFLGI